MGQCYENEQLKAVDQDKMELAAIQCYSRAVANGDREGIALHKLVSGQRLRMHQQCAGPDAGMYTADLVGRQQCGPARYCHAQAGGEVQESTVLRKAAVLY